ncbi:NAD-glutamate dehydrogenase [Novosphingobium album (ex Liu et al. 2023)]|uniref:NAD-glutamate dehydrogenase n=1 Tax=Novosphingobium album (ex Liu et al. 2023) TaxID=3031130 RepID=A0ABT5WMI8_9SPHN|nr:NAD-glutamate dehydrogenase domain-containing protein [Novosphingobium album (ex Liu et al. 2023)]MDE8651264.1 NAD-glutamate dehydrogenase [Novosphingobium album (ex Liu et al. 2023)]
MTATQTTAAARRRKAAGAPELEAEIAANIRDSLLPGDGPFEPGWVEDAAAFLLAAARTRQPGEPAIEMATVSEGHRHLRIALVNDDMPFLVDSVASAISASGLVIDRLVHPVMPVRRDGEGQLVALPPARDGDSTDESMIYIETARVDAKERRALLQTISATLADVRAAVADWPRMVEAMTLDAASLADSEGAQLLKWFCGGMLTQLGHVTRRRDGSHAQLLGVCRRSARAILADQSYARAFAWFDEALAKGELRAPMIVKANHIATVHRRVPLDLFIVPVIEEGKVAALSVHAGIWTSAALSTPPDRVPYLRQQLAGLSAKLGFDPNGHTGKALTHALTSLPHDLVVSFSETDVERVATAMTSLVDRPRPRLLLVEAPLARHLLAFVWLPRDMHSTEMRHNIQTMVEEAVGAPTLDWSLQVEAGTLAMLRYVLDIRDVSGLPSEQELDAHLQTMLRGWGEAVEAAIAAEGEASRAVAIAARYAEAFPLAYRTDYGATEAAIDIRHMRRLAGGESEDAQTRAGRRDARLYRHAADEPGRLRLKIYQYEGSLPLSDAVPALENFGFRVLAEMPTPLDHGRIGTIHDFLLALPAGREADAVLKLAPIIEDALCGVLNATGEDDAFNRLIPGLGLSTREATWLRAMYRYLRQTGTSYTIGTVVEALHNAPQVTLGIVDLFRARHDPAYARDRQAAEENAADAIRMGLAAVAAINDDRVLRLFRSIVDAVLRTNAFTPAAKEALAFKLDSALVPGLPRPVPWREIFVYSRRVEGIHLRAGPIARGGLRWSDRRDDFRTEILGLMKAQRVKNAVIVPTGAKGGFYPKQLPDPARDRAGWAAEGQAAYEIFIRALLSVTDNIVADKVVHPEGMVIRDGEDPYFVVAADKGTAKFSDVANGIAESADFWLDDAFASGGSNGYDHKAMGITARGAWISVQRHFREMGVDVQADPVRVAGCGDMSGDVFGNGMLLSRSIRLVAAFDHRHVFIDPDPDAGRSWAERKRLFDLPHSSWDDYDKALISKGGGVWPRTLKRIPLSDQMRALLDTDAAEMEPEALISAILAAPVDLLWFGGIGTYIKASAENNAAVGDPTNDPLRIDGATVRARVIGEGANLGVTQAGRIEFSSHGGRINTDFIDNSAGVDCSDNEVNIKIALAAARRAGKLSEAKRVALLRAMTDDVAELVLEDNRHQALALSIAERGGAPAMPSHIRLIELLEDSGNLDRRTEGLAESEALSRRALEGRGLTRPELAVLLSSTKLVLQEAIEQSTLPEDPGLAALLLATFPQAMQDKFARVIKGHRLRREIIATKLANRIVNRLGIVHPFELAEEEGVDIAQVAAAFTLAERLFGLGELWTRLEQADMPESARLALFDRLAVAVRGHMADLLRAGAGRITPSELEARLAGSVTALSRELADLLGEGARAHSEKLRAAFVAEGAPDAEAAAVVHLFDMDGAAGIAELAATTAIAPRRLVAAFTRIGAGLGLDWAQTTAALMNPSDPWERLLVAGLARDFQQMRLDFLKGLARGKAAKADPVRAVEQWGQAHLASIRAFRAMVKRAEATLPVAPAMLAQIASQARNLLAR